MILPIFIPIVVETFRTSEFFTDLSNTILNSCSICLFTSVTVILANLVDYFVRGYENNMSAAYGMHCFFVGFTIFAVLGIIGVVRNNLYLVAMSLLVWFILFTVWLAMCCLLFASWSTIPILCVNNRCPESFWLGDWYHKSFTPIEKNQTGFIVSGEPYMSNNSTPNTQPQLRKNSLYLFGSIMVFLSFMFFFAMLGSMMWNYIEAIMSVDEDLIIPRIPQAAAIIIIYPFKSYFGSTPEEEPNPNTPTSGPTIAAASVETPTSSKTFASNPKTTVSGMKTVTNQTSPRI